jgi:hypothetical protein
MKKLLAVFSVLSLVLCLAAPLLFFHGRLTESSFKLALALASAAWFFLATAWASYAKPKSS